MKEIRVEIDSNGKVRILYSGFSGGECFEEAKRLYMLLKSKGIQVTLEQVTPTQEYYQTSTSQKTREVLRNGGS
jgi:type 1 glutamine amidotransferase